MWKTKHDTDNIIKPLIDLLVKAKIIPNDTTRYINGVSVRYLQGFGKPVTTISYDYID
jgi:Holliday junction resolvase RusA-like endonuclease